MNIFAREDRGQETGDGSLSPPQRSRRQRTVPFPCLLADLLASLLKHGEMIKWYGKIAFDVSTKNTGAE